MTDLIAFSRAFKESGKLSANFGTVYRYNNHIYRTIERKYEKQVRGLMANAQLMSNLHQIGLVETSIAPVHTKNHTLVLEHGLIEFEALPEEWSPAMKIDAAIMHIDLHIELIKNGWCLWDGHEYNTLFDYTKPVWIDFHSIKSSIFDTTSVAWWDEFKFYVFDRLGCDETLWKTEFKKIKGTTSKERLLIFLDVVREAILAIQINPVKTAWFDYPRLSDANLDDKQKTTLEMMEKVKPFCDTFLDIGSNVGWYSRAASKMGYRVVAIDVDEACIEELYINTRASGDKILPLVSDFKTCLDVTAVTHSAFAERIQCDVTLSLALLHHLVFYQQATFPFIAERLDALSKKVAIVQFITREDSYVKHWLKSLGTKFDWYTMDNFISEMSKYFSKYEIFESSPSGRKLILFER